MRRQSLRVLAPHAHASRRVRVSLDVFSHARVVLRGLAVLGFAALALAGPAWAEFPERPITLIVGSSAGGGPDAAARLLGARIADVLHQPVVIEDRPGAYARIANAAVANSAADGYTLLLATATSAIDGAVDPDAKPNLLRDFTPVGTIAMSDLVLVVDPALPVRSVRELIAYARASQRKLNFSTPGARSINHLESERFALRTGMELVHVPFRGLAQALASIMSGDVQMSFASLQVALPLVKAGKLRALAVPSTVRSTFLPDVPTMKEAGLEDMEAATWYGILAPARTPPDIVDRLARAIEQVSRAPDYRRALSDMGAVPFVTTPEQFSRLLREETSRWGDVIKTAHIRME